MSFSKIRGKTWGPGRLGPGPHVVGQLGPGMRVSASFHIILRPAGRLGLGSGPNDVGRLESGIRTASPGTVRLVPVFKFLLYQPVGNVPGGERNCPSGEYF